MCIVLYISLRSALSLFISSAMDNDRHLSTVRSLCILCFFIQAIPIVESQSTPGGNRYYSSPGNASGYCSIAACNAGACGNGQYLYGCNFNSSGVCTSCTLPVLSSLQYYSSNGVFSNNCGVSSCQTCPNGQYNFGCSGSSAGTCAPCSNQGTLNPGYYWKPNTCPTLTCTQLQQPTCANGQYLAGATSTTLGTCTSCGTPPAYKYWLPYTGPSYVCTYSNQTTCAPGYVNSLVSSYSTTTAGTCSACPTSTYSFYYTANTNPLSNCPMASCPVSSCGTGLYLMGCTNANLGQCVACTNANSTQEYSSNGGMTNNCHVVGCTYTCSPGQYISGCGGLASSLSCAQCNPPLLYLQPGNLFAFNMPDRALHRLLQRVLRRRVRGHFARAVHLLYKHQLNGFWVGESAKALFCTQHPVHVRHVRAPAHVV